MFSTKTGAILVVFAIQALLWSALGDGKCNYGAPSSNTINKNIDDFYIVGFKTDILEGFVKVFVIHKGVETVTETTFFDPRPYAFLGRDNARLFVSSDPRVFFAIAKTEQAGMVVINAAKITYKLVDAKPKLEMEILKSPTKVKNVQSFNLKRAMIVGKYIVNVEPCMIYDTSQKNSVKVMARKCNEQDFNPDILQTNVKMENLLAARENYPLTSRLGNDYFIVHNIEDSRFGRPVGLEACVTSYEDITVRDEGFESRVTFKFSSGETQCFMGTGKYEVQLHSPALGVSATAKEICTHLKFSYFTKGIVENRTDVTAPPIGIGAATCETLGDAFAEDSGLIGASVTAGVSTIVGLVFFIIGMIGRGRYQRHKQEKIDLLGSAAYATTTDATTMGSTMETTVGESQTAGGTTGGGSTTAGGTTTGGGTTAGGTTAGGTTTGSKKTGTKTTGTKTTGTKTTGTKTKGGKTKGTKSKDTKTKGTKTKGTKTKTKSKDSTFSSTKNK